MQVTLTIPDEFAEQMMPSGKDPSRVALETLAVEGYRAERLTEAEIQRLLGLETRAEVHALLKERGAYLHYSLEDAERDRQRAHRAQQTRQEKTAERRAG